MPTSNTSALYGGHVPPIANPPHIQPTDDLDTRTLSYIAWHYCLVFTERFLTDPTTSTDSKILNRLQEMRRLLTNV